MKRKTAKEILSDSFHELAEDRQIDKITVREIAANCGYSSATFYRQFRDKYDLIAWDYAQQIEKLMRRIGVNGYTWKQALWDCLEHFQKEKEYLGNILTHTSGHDSFIFYMTEIHCTEVSAYVSRRLGMPTLDAKMKMYMHLESSTLAPLLKRLENQGLIDRIAPQSKERKLVIDLTEKGRAMKLQAEKVPAAMRGCIPLETEELLTLKEILCKAVERMHSETDIEKEEEK